jgi:glyoxylase I family protein
MTALIPTGPINHLTFTVSDIDRAREFYTNVLGFQVVTQLGSRLLLGNGAVILALGLPPAPNQAIPGDRFDENRIGLDHLSFTAHSHADLLKACTALDAAGVPRGEIRDLTALHLHVLAFRDPDNIQLELTAPFD